MQTLFTYIQSWFSLLPDFTFSNFLEVLIIAFVIYELLLMVKTSHAIPLIKGIAVILVFTLFAAALELDNILWIMQNISTVAVIALVVIFQPELRKGLEILGKQNLVTKLVSFEPKVDDWMSEKSCNEISKAVFEMAKVKTGALIVIQHVENLESYINTGIRIDGIVSAALLINIFEKNTPLHDGAVVINGNTVVAATCYLPLSDSDSISKDLGTRHRAAIGMTEATDTTVLVVSEETGHISMANEGKLTRITSYEQLNAELMRLAASIRHSKNTTAEKKKKSRREK